MKRRIKPYIEMASYCSQNFTEGNNNMITVNHNPRVNHRVIHPDELSS
jgi:hypothetical protein